MLKEAVRRLLWLGPTLLIVTLPLFWAIARTTDRTSAAPRTDLPLFFNPNPVGVRERAIEASDLVAAGGPGAEAGAEMLVRLGGAAFPYVLPRFDALGPDARGRVALALAPVARRMGIATGMDIDTKDTAVVVFSRFWDEHAIDFRPGVVRRTVRRFVEHPSALRASEVLELDTVALEDLVDALGQVKTREDADRVRHITDVAARIADKPWTIAAGATIGEAARAAGRWKRFWVDEQSTYVTFTGPRRLVATVLETRYGRWLSSLVRPGSGGVRLRGRTAGLIRRRGPLTLTLVASGFFVGYPLAVAFGVALRKGVARPRRATFAVALTCSTIGVAGAAALLRHTFGSGLLEACVAVTLVTAAMALRHQRTIAGRAYEQPHLRTAIAFGASRLRVAFLAARLGLATAAALAVADVPSLFTSALVAERVFSLHGIGETTILALRTGDQAVLLSIAVVGTLIVGLAQIGADLLLLALDPRVRRGPRRIARSLG